MIDLVMPDCPGILDIWSGSGYGERSKAIAVFVEARCSVSRGSVWLAIADGNPRFIKSHCRAAKVASVAAM